MANQITTAQDLQDVLDAIYNNRDQYDTYQNLTLYYNDITRTATIFAVNEEEAEVPTQDVVAVFNPENVVTTNNAFFVTLMKSATVNVSTEETSVYDFALGGYVDVNTLLKNICVALGVSLSGTFADANPTLYSDMINIIRNEYGQSLENNAPYIMKKFVNVSTQEETYKSLIPLMCIVKIAIYLNNLGIFNTTEFYPLTPTPLSYRYFFTPVGVSTSDMKYYFNTLVTKTDIDIPKTSDHFSLKSKNKFKEDLKKWLYDDNGINWLGNSYISPQPLVSDPNNLKAVDKIFDLYENDIDWGNEIVKMGFYRTSDTEHMIRFYTSPKDKAINTVFNNRPSYNYQNSKGYDMGGAGKTGTTVYGLRTAIEDNTPYTTYIVTVKLNTNTQEIEVTNSKTVNASNKGIAGPWFGSGWILMDNLKQDGYVKPYTANERIYNSSGSLSTFYYIDRYIGLSMNTEYNINNIKLLGNDKRHYYIDYTTDEVLKKNNYDVNIGANDLVATFRLTPDVYSNTTYNIIKIVVIRNVDTFTLKGNSPYGVKMANPFQRSCQHEFIKYLSNKQRYNNVDYDMAVALPVIGEDYAAVDSYIRIGTNENAAITFSTAKTIDIYTVDYRGIENDNVIVDYQTRTTDNFLFKSIASDIQTQWDLMCKSNNLGEWIDFGEDSGIEGLSLLDGATYPKNVFDLNSFNTIYPNWFKTQSNNPQIVNGVLAPTVTSTQWGAVSISKTTPTTQGDSEGGDIDFTNPEEVQDIIDDTEKATEDEDTDTGGEAEKDNDVGDTNEGATPLPPGSAQIAPIAGARIFAVTYAELQTLMDRCMNPDIWQTVGGLDPLKYIISVQATQSHSYNQSDAAVYSFCNSSVHFIGEELTGVELFADYNFGQAYIPAAYMNYNDVTATSISIYLPYVGYVDLDITDFLDRFLILKAKVDLTNGNIIYYVGVNELGGDENTLQYIYQFTGNCHRNLPISSQSSILLGLKNTFKLPLGKLD